MAAGDFAKRNDSFICEFCGKPVPPAKKTSRNHCPYCLYAKHVDIVPGDRLEVCQGLMKPIDYDYKHGTVIILHKCVKCGKLQHNKAAEDDFLDELLQSRLVGA